MNKSATISIHLGVLFVIMISLGGCDTETDVPVSSSIEKMCILSGGEYEQQSERCICNHTKCVSGSVCDASSKECVKFQEFKDICTETGGKFDETNRQCSCNGVVCGNQLGCNPIDGHCLLDDSLSSKCVLSGGTPGENERCLCPKEQAACSDNIYCLNDYCANNFRNICSLSGGVFTDNGHCKCGSDICSDGLVCFDGKCAGSMKNVTDECSLEGSSTCSDGKIWQCRKNDNGQMQWIEDKNCINNASCTIQNECGECSDTDPENNHKCENDKYFVCNNGEWVNAEDCFFGCNTKSKKCNLCTQSCTNDENNIGHVVQCNQDGHELVTCDKTSCDSVICGECMNGTVKCENSYVENTDFPESGTLWKCENGRWIVDKKCILCQDEKCADCIANKCEDDENGIGHVSECIDYTLQPPTACHNVSCNAGQCGNCNTKDYPDDKLICEGDNRVTCPLGALTRIWSIDCIEKSE